MLEQLNLTAFGDLYHNEGAEYGADEMLRSVLPPYLFAFYENYATDKEKPIYRQAMLFFADTLKKLHAERKEHESEWGSFYKLIDTMIEKKFDSSTVESYRKFIAAIEKPERWQTVNVYYIWKLMHGLNKFCKCLQYDEIFMEACVRWNGSIAPSPQ